MEAMEINIFKRFDLRRIRYLVPEKANPSRHTQDALAWLCNEHLHDGLYTGTLESYPCQFYHNLEYDEQCRVVEVNP